MDVVTNSQEFKAGNRAVVCFLPPRQFENTVSEGMFVSAQFDSKGELSHEEILGIRDKLGEVETIVLGFL